MNETHTSTDLLLTANQVKALRTADSVSFHHNDTFKGIHATKRVDEVWRRESEVEIPVYSTVRIHRLDDEIPSRDATCFDLIHTAQYCEFWRTIASLLKAGDVIELEWVGSDDNGYVKRSKVTETVSEGGSGYSPGFGMRLHHDKVYLHIRRGSNDNGLGKRKYSFYLSDSVCPNNTARMVRPK